MPARANPLSQSRASLTRGADLASQPIQATTVAGLARLPSPEATALAQGTGASPRRPGCTQCITISIFFDGTGNNLDADLPTGEHSNVARLFLAHVDDDEPTQTYRRYVPGIGTYFPGAGDPGGTMTGLGLGAYGQARLDWAFKEVATLLRKAEARAANPSNRIVAVKLAVFGFSRGAATARAFCRDLQKSCSGTKGNHLVKNGLFGTSGMALKGGYPIDVYFLGIFDTVASVGVLLSTNNFKVKRRSGFGWRDILADGGFGRSDVDLQMLAFGEPGADPAPGTYDGHASWADDLRIPGVVSRCVHMVAAHEIRNSFPLDSALDDQVYPEGTIEMVYPGVHSDVGGGYHDGEGAKRAVLSAVPLRNMLQLAIDASVPLYGLSQLTTEDQKKDFALDAQGSKAYAELLNVWQEYMKPVNTAVPLGQCVLAHMAAYWRYRLTVAVERTDPSHAARPGRGGRSRVLTTEQAEIKKNDAGWSKERDALSKEAQTRRSEYQRLSAQRSAAEESLRAAKASPGFQNQVPMWESMVQDLKAKEAIAADAAGRAQARLDTAADDSGLIGSLDDYDEWLLDDAALIHRMRMARPKDRMRPHYNAIANAYQEVVVEGRRLKHDTAIYRLFSTYVHDSLAGFAKDNTRPSDPRVIYIGGDKKAKYAKSEPLRAESTATV